MSIIYDALKKVENKADLTKGTHVKRTTKKRPYALYLVVIIAGLVLASFVHKSGGKYFASATKMASGEYKLAKGKFNLNGIFFSGDASYALINNQIVKEGDVVLGAKVSNILMEEVVLEKEGAKLRLSNKKE